MIYDHFNKNGYYPSLFGRELNSDEIQAVRASSEQSISMYDLWQDARIYDAPYADRLYNEWLAGGHEPTNLFKAFYQIIDVGTQSDQEPSPHPEPVPGPEPSPSPGSWTPPTATGFVTSKIPGPVFMSSLPMPDGLLVGTYRGQSGTSRLLRYGGTVLHLELETPAESFYFPYMTPDGLPIWTTECDFGKVYKHTGIGWHQMSASPLANALTFEPYRLGDSLYCWRPDYANAPTGTVIKGDLNGLNWTPYRAVSFVAPDAILNMGSDGNSLVLVGRKNRLPWMQDIEGRRIVHRGGFIDCEYSYAIGKDGVWNMAANSTTEQVHGHRRHYIDIFSNGVARSVYSSAPPDDQPWIMDGQMFDGIRYFLASSWQETDHNYSVLLSSANGEKWGKVCDIPMRSAISMSFANSGVYISGGQYGQYGAVYFVKL